LFVRTNLCLTGPCTECTEPVAIQGIPKGSCSDALSERKSVLAFNGAL